MRIAMIGPSQYPEGGTSIPFKILVDHMRSSGIAVDVVPIPRGGRNVLTKPLKFLRILMQTVWAARHVDLISVHLPTPQLSNIGFASLIVARFFRKVFIVRQFTGTDSTELRWHKRWLAEQVVQKGAVMLVEAKGQCEVVRECFSRDVFWYPNYRLMPAPRPYEQTRNGRFVYIGRVRDDKGIGDIIKAAALPGKPCSVDVYGPCERPFKPSRFRQSKHVRYMGVVESRDVPSILARYTALLLPTYWEGEGYPGIVIEAFQRGTPVIATRWKYLPEVVDEDCGILIAPKDPQGLRRAINRLVGDSELVRRLRFGALMKGREFSAERWAHMFIGICQIAGEYSGCGSEMKRRIEELYAHVHKCDSAASSQTAQSPEVVELAER